MAIASRTSFSRFGFVAVALLAISTASGCAPSFDLVDGDGLPLFEVRQSGVCFIGCNLYLKRSDGVLCSGYAVAIEEGRSLAAQIRCPDDPSPRDLETETLDRDIPARATLGQPKTLKQRNDEAISAALARAENAASTN